jgi:formylglycine-generating enzyme required for sulfatase activity
MLYQAFVSSTFVDLKDHRAHVIGSLRRAGFAVDPAEDWTADSDEPKNFCQDRLNGCDLCVLLVAFRRGYVPEGETLSITQLEYEAAVKAGIDILPFMLEENAPWPPNFVELDKDPGIKRWREELRKRHGVEHFSLEPRSIDMAGALGRWLAKKNRQQQVRGRAAEAPNSKSEEILTKITWDISKSGSPYPGLMHFTRKYNRVFFGRDDEVREVLYRIQKPEGRFIIISGDSGVGKSSVVDAGLLPKLEDGALPGNENCVAVRMVPGQGGQPFGAMMTALGSFATRAGLRPHDIIEELEKSPGALTQYLRKITVDGADGKTIVLFLDQMEELFTTQDVRQSNVFLTALYEAAQVRALWVLATIRSDHLHFCHRHPEMLQVLRGQGHYPLGRVEQFMIHDMIVRPANCAGLKISDHLARSIVSDTGSESANLPLLAFVLNQLFEKRVDHELSEDVYKTLGGVGGAIAEHVKVVEETIRRELIGRAPELLPKIFQSLVIVNPEGLPTRRRPLLADFPPELRPAVDLLIRERLFHTEGEGEKSTVSISHEKLFEAWPALREYVEANKKLLVDQTLVETRARKWVNMGKPWFSGLAAGREYRDFRRAGVPTLEAKEYLQASRRAVWLRDGAVVVLASIFFFIAAAWRQGLSVEHTLLKFTSTLISIHLEPEIVDIKAGSFRMGDTQGLGNRDEQPVHPVQIQKPFKMGRYEVTFEEYDRFALVSGRRRPNDWGWGRGRHPVVDVSWEDAVVYAQWLSKQTGKRYRLPTEAEWEYAARSLGKEEIWAGTSSESELGNYAWYFVNSKSQAQEVGYKKPNGLGLHDMSGNVREWVEDCWHENYNGAPTDGSAWLETGDGECARRVMRGGSWNAPVGLHSSYRGRGRADFRTNFIGFRLAQDID